MPLQYISQGNKILKWLRQIFVKEKKRFPIGNEIEELRIQADTIDDAFAKVDEVMTFDFPNCKKKKNEKH